MNTAVRPSYPPGELRWHVVSAGYSTLEISKALIRELRKLPKGERVTIDYLAWRAGIDLEALTPVEQVCLIEAADLAFTAEGYRTVGRRKARSA